MEVSLTMAPKTSKSQDVADFCCGWGNCHICIMYADKILHIMVINLTDMKEGGAFECFANM
jgi:hypothetical protein